MSNRKRLGKTRTRDIIDRSETIDSDWCDSDGMDVARVTDQVGISGDFRTSGKYGDRGDMCNESL